MSVTLSELYTLSFANSYSHYPARWPSVTAANFKANK
jgi:hypothetical protein